jgi:hypothetical protein
MKAQMKRDEEKRKE